MNTLSSQSIHGAYGALRTAIAHAHEDAASPEHVNIFEPGRHALTGALHLASSLAGAVAHSASRGMAALAHSSESPAGPHAAADYLASYPAGSGR